MRLQIVATEATAAAAALSSMAPRIREAHAKDAYTAGAEVVALIRSQQYRRAPETTDTATRVRTSKLINAYSHHVQQDAAGVTLSVGLIKPSIDAKVLAYAPTQEYGATIRAKPGHALAIPLDAALTAAGVARGNPRDFANTFIRVVNGKGFLFQKQGTEIVPLFMFVQQVTVPARPALQPAMDTVLPKLEERVTADTLRIVGVGA